jgi:hypothetical protein
LNVKTAAKRSTLNRRTVREPASPLQPKVDVEPEEVVVRRHRTRLAREAAVLVREQAMPPESSQALANVLRPDR